MSRHTAAAVIALFVFSCTAAHVRADDGGIMFGGSPRLLAGHPSVSMQSEVVYMTIGPEMVAVDCRFVFRNDGPACHVRMGFPDQGRDGGDPDEGGLEPHPTGTFSSYTSFVDGVKAPTGLIRAQKEGNYWHAKVVPFPAHSTRRVRDVYTVLLGGGITADGRGHIAAAYYILHTGSSWHGQIGRAEIDVTFAPGTIPTPLVPTPLSAAPDNIDGRYAWSRHPRGTVLFRGPSVPTVQGRTLRFVRADFKPAYIDDVLLSFGFQAIHGQ